MFSVSQAVSISATRRSFCAKQCRAVDQCQCQRMQSCRCVEPTGKFSHRREVVTAKSRAAAAVRPLACLRRSCKFGSASSNAFRSTCSAAAACAASSACFHCSLAISALLTLGAQMIRRANTDCPQIAMGAWMRSCRHSCCYTGGSLRLWTGFLTRAAVESTLSSVQDVLGAPASA